MKSNPKLNEICFISIRFEIPTTCALFLIIFNNYEYSGKNWILEESRSKIDFYNVNKFTNEFLSIWDDL